MTIEYHDSVEGLKPLHLDGFFEGWPDPPSAEVHLRILQAADLVVLARVAETEAVVGFVTALSDGVLSAYLPLLEVLPEFRGRGIGRELVRRVLGKLDRLYMVDLVCDEELQPFYASLGLRPFRAMGLRRFEYQSGE